MLSAPLLAVVIALALVGGAVGLYIAARQTSLFALDRIEVTGAPAPVAARIRSALADYQGRSLVRFDGTDARRRIAGVSEVANATFDRDFPHTLKVRVRLERPVAVLRRGSDCLARLGECPCPATARAQAVPAPAEDLAACGDRRLRERDPGRRRRDGHRSGCSAPPAAHRRGCSPGADERP